MDTPQNEVKAARVVRDIGTEALEEQLKDLDKEVYFMTSFSPQILHHKPHCRANPGFSSFF